MTSTTSPRVAFRTILLLLAPTLASASGTDLRVNTDFEGASAIIESVDQVERMIRLMPGGDPQRGWPCWWSIRVDGLEKGERAIISLTGNDRVQKSDTGQEIGKPLSSSWAMPMKATFSTDGETWQHTAPGRRDGNRILYEVTGSGGPLWVAWGPPFTPRDTDALIAQAVNRLPTAKSFDLAQTREGRAVSGLRVNDSKRPDRLGIWVQARQHAWESGASWVARGFVEWLTSKDSDARWLRENAEVVVVPIMDVDNVATGNGGKNALPRDHNRAWSEASIYPEVTAAQKHLHDWASAGKLDLFIDLHNPAPGDVRPFFYVGPEELLDAAGRKSRADFITLARQHISDPLLLEEKPRVTGPKYHPLWQQMSAEWVTIHARPKATAICLETPWNTPHSTSEGYRTVARQLGQTMAAFFRQQVQP